MTPKILIADTEEGTLNQLAHSLEQAGYSVVTAANCEQVLAKASSERPDLVCLEIHLPGIGGLEVCRTLKAERAVPVLLTVSHLDDKTSAGFLTVGAEDLIFKPFFMDEVIDKVAWFLDPKD